MSGAVICNPEKSVRTPAEFGARQDRLLAALYFLVAAISIALWFVAIRAPLWGDETGSYWQISGGFSQLWARRNIYFPAYTFVLCVSTKFLGTSEIALRIPSILAMLTAAGLIYRAARELFDREVAFIATIVFCVNPIVVFAAIDIRPYAFAVLATNAAILALLRLRHTDSWKSAALFGALAAIMVWFHYLFAAVLPGFIVAYWSMKGFRKASWRQFGIAVAVFAAVFLPVIPGLLSLFRSSSSHVFEPAPTPQTLLWTLVTPWMGAAMLLTLLLVLLMAAARVRTDRQAQIQRWQIVFCAAAALIPIFLLYGVSAWTPIHSFERQHRLMALPGIALCWACMLSLIRYRVLRFAFCLTLVGLTTFAFLTQPVARKHLFSWKAAINVVEKNASVDGAPVLMCSDFVEADYAQLPDFRDTKQSSFFAPLSYYRLTVPVYGLPRTLNDVAKRRGSGFVQKEAQRHQRFFAMAFLPSYPTLDWISGVASGSYDVHTVGIYDAIKVLEFDPKPEVQGVENGRADRARIPAR